MRLRLGDIVADLRAGALRLLRQRWVDLTFAAVVIYFGFHAVHGERGFLAWVDRSREVGIARAELARLESEQASLEVRIAELRPGRPEPDAVEEELRRLGYIAEGEVIVLPQETVGRP